MSTAAHPVTDYFQRDVLVKRPYIQKTWCIAIIEHPIKRELQSDGRIRHWGFVPELGRYLGVITLEDGITIHNAFPDRRFTP